VAGSVQEDEVPDRHRLNYNVEIRRCLYVTEMRKVSWPLPVMKAWFLSVSVDNKVAKPTELSPAP
jgi:hypothetical protein